MPFWTSSSGRIELDICASDADGASHPGPCDADVSALSREPYIAEQLAKIDAAELREELRGYGAWDERELTDHAMNLQRVLWLACGYINDEEATA
jgi:hypothetical protein